MNIQLFTMLFVGLGVIYLAIGIYAARSVKTTEDYFLAGRSLGVSSVAFTLIATQIGGGLLLGTAEESFRSGYIINSGTLYPLGIALGFILLGLWFAEKLRAFNVATIPQLFEKKFGSATLKKVASVISILSLSGIVAALIVSSRGLIYGLGIRSDLLIISFWILVILYTMIGGLKSVVLTDIYQVAIIVLISFSVFVYTFWQDPYVFASSSGFFDMEALSSGKMRLTGFLLMPILFSLVEQDLAQRFFAAKNRRVAAVSALWGSIGILLFAFIPVFFGIKARMMNIFVPVGANPLIVLLGILTNEWVMAIVVCAVMAAIVSTGDSVLNAISSLAAQDFETGFSEKNKLIFSRLLTFVIGIASLFVAYFSTGILSIMTQSYELPVSCLFIPILFCFFTDKYLDKTAATYSIIFGFVGFFLFRYWSIGIPREIATLILSFCGYIFGFKMAGLYQDEKRV